MYQMIPLIHLHFSIMSSKVMPGGRQQITLATSLIHDLFIAAHTNRKVLSGV